MLKNRVFSIKIFKNFLKKVLTKFIGCVRICIEVEREVNDGRYANGYASGL